MAGPLLKKEYRKLFTNLEEVYDLPRHSIFARTFAHQVLEHQVIVALEAVRVMGQDRDELNILGYDSFKESINRLRSHNKGVIVITGHLGCWELVARYSARATDSMFNALAKPSKNAAVTSFLDRSRARMNTHVLWNHKKSILKDMLRVLKNGDVLGFVMDQKPEKRQGPEVDFFGRRTPFVSGPAKLACKQDVPVVAVFCLREGAGSYRIIHKVIRDVDDPGQTELDLTQKMASEIERVIRLYPEQWVWNYKRWKF